MSSNINNKIALEDALEQISQSNNLMFFVSNSLTTWDTDILAFNKQDMQTVGQLLYVAWQQNQAAVQAIEGLAP